jgi:hypothetical protein
MLPASIEPRDPRNQSPTDYQDFIGSGCGQRVFRGESVMKILKELQHSASQQAGGKRTFA